MEHGFRHPELAGCSYSTVQLEAKARYPLDEEPGKRRAEFKLVMDRCYFAPGMLLHDFVSVKFGFNFFGQYSSRLTGRGCQPLMLEQLPSINLIATGSKRTLAKIGNVRKSCALNVQQASS